MNKVLLIDNQPMLRFATRVLLEREDYEVVGETESGVEGLSMARSLRPDLVILVDSPEFSRFDETDRAGLERFVSTLLAAR